MAGDWHIKSIFHFTVNATNFERSLDFYTTIGFKVLRDNRDVIWPRMVARNFGMPAAQGRGALLGIGDGELHTRLDLIEWLEPDARSAARRSDRAARAAHHRVAHRERAGRVRGSLGARHRVRVAAAVVEERRHRERVRVPRSRRAARRVHRVRAGRARQPHRRGRGGASREPGHRRARGRAVRALEACGAGGATTTNGAR